MAFNRLLLLTALAILAPRSWGHPGFDPAQWREDGDYLEYKLRHHEADSDLVMPNLQGLWFDETMHTLLKHQLPFDRPIDLVLDSNTIRQRFYFQIFKRRENLTLTVTPCISHHQQQARIELYFIRSKTLKKFRKRKVGRRSRSSLVKMVTKRLLNHPSNRRLVLVHHSVSARITLGADLVFEPGLYIVQASEVQTDDSTLPVQDRAIRLQLYLASYGRAPYPAVPPVASIMVKQTNQGRSLDILTNGDELSDEPKLVAEIWWNPIVAADRGKFEYCLLVSEAKPYRDQCLATADDPSLNEENPWFWTEAELDRHPGPADLKQLAYHRCWPAIQATDSSRTVVNGLKPSQLYFVDVFVRDMDRPTLVSKYWTSNFSLTGPTNRDRAAWRHRFYSMQTMHDGLLTGVFLDSRNQYRKRFVYKLQDRSAKIYIYLQPCTGIGPIQLMVRQIEPTAGGRQRRHEQDMEDEQELSIEPQPSMLLFEEITETRTVEVSVPDAWLDNQTEPILIEMELNTLMLHQTRSLVMLASESLARFPFPRLPADKTIRAMETLAQCDSVTLVWNASPDDRVTYCIMQRDAKYGVGFEESKHLCQKIRAPPTAPAKRGADATEPPPVLDAYSYAALISSQPTRKVLCRRYKARRRRANNQIMQQVRKLHPGRQYIFLVTIKARQHTLYYEQVWAETRPLDQCLGTA